MTPSRDHFGRALSQLRERIRSGRHAGGEPLTVTDLAVDLGLSATPVREALSRLTGEGLIEDRRGRGYFMLRLDVADLDEIYQLNLLYLTGALEAPHPPMAQPHPRGWTQRLAAAMAGPEREEALASFTEVLFHQIALESFNRALIGAERRLADILAPVRRIEPSVLSATEAELAVIAARLDGGDQQGLIAALRAYHTARRANAAAIMNALNWRG